jgi:cytochrome c553
MVNPSLLSRLCLGLALLFGASGLVEAGEEPAALATCVACHGKNGVGIDPSYANLGGQNTAYLALQLKGFRSGHRSNLIMNRIAGQLSDQDINALAQWFSEQPLVTAVNGNPDLVEEGRNRAAYCHACHGMQGHPVAVEWPIIAGQSAPYIQNQLMAFKQGTRYHPLMANVVKDLEASAMSALGAYYAQVVRQD